MSPVTVSVKIQCAVNFFHCILVNLLTDICLYESEKSVSLVCTIPLFLSVVLFCLCMLFENFTISLASEIVQKEIVDKL